MNLTTKTTNAISLITSDVNPEEPSLPHLKDTSSSPDSIPTGLLWALSSWGTFELIHLVVELGLQFRLLSMLSILSQTLGQGPGAM